MGEERAKRSAWTRSTPHPQVLNVNGYFARTRTPGVHHEDTSRLARFDYNTDRFGVQLEHLAVWGNFKPEVGFLRRTDFQRQFALARFSPPGQHQPI